MAWFALASRLWYSGGNSQDRLERDRTGSVMVQANAVNYDCAAGEYATHRRIHSGVLRELGERGRLGASSTVLEVGCGTGNHIRALAKRFGCICYGLDPSEGMLAQACAGPEGVTWLLGQAQQLGFGDGTFDLIFSVDVIHHVADRGAFFCETARTLRPGGRVCTATDSAEIIRRREILSGYFPETVEIELARYPRIAQLERWMAEAGLTELQVITVEESYEITSAQPFRDKAFSSLHLLADEVWQAGVERLERDLARGPVRGASRYACVWGRRPG
jgi:ubiquinone/menaquinone biosynthesis C-methylase UbiE